MKLSEIHRSRDGDLDLLVPVLQAIGTPRFGDALLQCLETSFGIAELFAYVSVGEHPDCHPKVVVTSSVIAGVEARSAHYCGKFFPFDPAWNHFAEMQSGDLLILRSRLFAQPRDINRLIFAERSGLDEKISIGWMGAQLIVLNVYRVVGEATSDEALARLTRLAPELAMAIVAHSHRMPEQGAQATMHLGDVERRLGRMRPDLPRREREVCARTVLGMTAHAIADDLAIGAATVTTYRRRAYDRLGINTPYQLLGWFTTQP